MKTAEDAKDAEKRKIIKRRREINGVATIAFVLFPQRPLHPLRFSFVFALTNRCTLRPSIRNDLGRSLCI